MATNLKQVKSGYANLKRSGTWRNVWVYCQLDANGAPLSVAFELLGRGRELADELLVVGDVGAVRAVTKVREVATRVGILDPSYFARLFKKHVGVSPSVFRNRSEKS